MKSLTTIVVWPLMKIWKSATRSPLISASTITAFGPPRPTSRNCPALPVAENAAVPMKLKASLTPKVAVFAQDQWTITYV